MRKCPPAGGCLRTSLQFRGTTLVSCIWHLLQCSENQKRIKLLVCFGASGRCTAGGLGKILWFGENLGFVKSPLRTCRVGLTYLI